MLQKFTVENFLSFKNKEVFSLLPSKGTLKKEHKVEPIKGQWVLKSAAVFGANAGGKSNFVKALWFGKMLILKGTRPNDLIKYRPFRLCSECKAKDTSMSYQIICNHKKYEYGFRYNAEEIKEEWLKVFHSRKTFNYIFYRNTETGDFDISYLLKLNPKTEESQFLTFFAKATPKRQLFIHEVLSRNIHDNVTNISDIEAILDWFLNSLKIIFPDTEYNQGVLLKSVNDKELKQGFSALLKYFNTGIDGIELIDFDFDKLGIPQELQNVIKNDILNENSTESFGSLKIENNLFLISSKNGEIKAQKLMTKHYRINENAFELFSPKEESDGTRRIFDFIPLILDLILGDKVFIVDEIERSLHPSLIQQLINLFYTYSKDISSQLLFTTHESSLMNLKILRRDEIWLMNKDDNGISSLGRLDCKYNNIRFDKTLQQSYLNGDYGATPNFNSEEEIIKSFKSFKQE